MPLLMMIRQKVVVMVVVVVSIERSPGVVVVQSRLRVAISERRLFDQEFKHFCGEAVVKRVDKLGKVERDLWLEGEIREISKPLGHFMIMFVLKARTRHDK